MTTPCDVTVADDRISVNCTGPMSADEALQLASRLQARALEVKGHPHGYGPFDVAIAEAAASELEHHLDHSADPLDICAFMMHRALLSDYFYGGWDDGVRNVWEAYADANGIKKLTDATAGFELTVSPSPADEAGKVLAAVQAAVSTAVAAALDAGETVKSVEVTGHDLSAADEDGFIEVTVTVTANEDEHFDRFEDAAAALDGVTVAGRFITDVSTYAPADD